MSEITTKADGLIDRRTFVKNLLADRKDDLLIVAGLGSPCYDLMSAGDHPLNFYLWGAMGGAVPMTMGLAAAQPSKRVLTLTGDGEVLMGLTGLAAAGAEGLQNMVVIVLDNERYGETGQQTTHTARGVDLVQTGIGLGYKSVRDVRSPEEAAELREWAMTVTGPALAVVKISPEAPGMELPPQDGVHLKNRFRDRLGMPPS
ncbi:MAG: thiamine pyrophosphate-dependent enzyme [Alphaproteobacteria bacterium]|jgi:thiamine pyrophosphate-dependent acetolactate synthase large subunit-like protein